MSLTLNQRMLVEERRRRTKNAFSTKLARLFRTLTPIQLAFINDPHRFKVAVAGRRGGKSYAIGAYMLRECLSEPNIPVLYVGLTRDSAKAIIWPILLGMLDGLDIPYEARPSALNIRFPNGSFIQLVGGDTPNAANRLRGRKFKLVAADETGFFVGIDPLLEALIPTLADYTGTLVMASSPGVLLSGFFYDAYAGKKMHEWRQYHWTMKDNPFFQTPARDKRFRYLWEEEMDTVCRLQFGGNFNHPGFRREYLGKYVRDDSSLVYPFTDANLVDKAEQVPAVRYGLGIDLGSVSANAIVAVQFSEYSREVTVVDMWKQPNVSIDALAAEIEVFQQKYHPDVIVADTGGYGKGIVDEIRRRYSMPIKPAEKQDKAFYQRIVNNDLRSGYIKCIKNLQILDEWCTITKDELGDEIKGQENHASDAFLYIYRYVYNTHLKSATVAVLSDEQRIINRLEAAYREQQSQENDEWI